MSERQAFPNSWMYFLALRASASSFSRQVAEQLSPYLAGTAPEQAPDPSAGRPGI